MEEFLGHMIAGWPLWLIIVTAIIFCVIGGLLILIFGDGVTEPWWPFKRKKHNKK